MFSVLFCFFVCFLYVLTGTFLDGLLDVVKLKSLVCGDGPGV